MFKKKKDNQKVGSKSLLAVGPTLHYSHNNVLTCWWLTIVFYAVTCLLWSKIVSGSFFTFSWETVSNPELWQVGRFVTGGVNIFEFPWQILVLGMLMGIIAIVPVLVSQLMSFKYSILFAFIALFFANLPMLAIVILISCFAVACRPLRFRSRFIAVALCSAPQLVYWAISGRAEVIEPVKWGVAYLPWLCAWLIGLSIAGLVLGIGHFTRYRPGLIWSSTFLFLLLSIFVFEVRIGFSELDYQLYVAKYNPEEVPEFYDHRITDALDRTITNESVINYLAGFFYPTEPIPLRERLKEELQASLAEGRWPLWFIVPEEMKYQGKREELFKKYNHFINNRPKSERMPIALYYKAVLSEFSPDLKILEQKEILSFYSDYPFERSRALWYRLYREFGESRESIEARWRIAMDWASQGQFNEAVRLLDEAKMMIRSDQVKKEKEYDGGKVSGLFEPSAKSAINELKMQDIKRRVEELRVLISQENRTGDRERDEYLAKFVNLNPHALDYAIELDELLEEMEDDHPLRDNIMLAKAKLLEDEHLKAERLAKLHEKYSNRDAGIKAYYELAHVKKKLWQQTDSDSEQSKKQLQEARDMLKKFVNSYPKSIYSGQAEKILANLPEVEKEQ